jgi:hypothetical protein
VARAGSSANELACFRARLQQQQVHAQQQFLETKGLLQVTERPGAVFLQEFAFRRPGDVKNPESGGEGFEPPRFVGDQQIESVGIGSQEFLSTWNIFENHIEAFLFQDGPNQISDRRTFDYQDG